MPDIFLDERWMKKTMNQPNMPDVVGPVVKTSTPRPSVSKASFDHSALPSRNLSAAGFDNALIHIVPSFVCLCIHAGKSVCVRTAGSIWQWCISGESRWARSAALWRTRPGGLAPRPRSDLFRLVRLEARTQDTELNLCWETNTDTVTAPALGGRRCFHCFHTCTRNPSFSHIVICSFL